MANIPATEARSIFTKALIAIYQETPTPTAFLRSFFKMVEEGTKYLSIEVQRGSEKIAVDVLRGTEGNRNTFSKSTEKIFYPPYYREFMDATELDLYDRMFSPTGMVDENMVSNFAGLVASKLKTLQAKIERAYEKQCADVFETGIVSLVSGDAIDFKRKAASLVDKGAGNYWATGAVDPFADLTAAGTFLRQVGKSQGGTLNAIFGSTALSDLLKNTTFTTRQNLFNMALDMVAAPQRNSVGASFQGQLTAGTFKVNIWSYPEFYDNGAGVSTPYMNPKNVVVLPENPNFVLGFAAVPQLIMNGGVSAVKGAYKISEKMDEYNAVHQFDIKSAGLAIPVAVDQIYTVKVVA